MIKFDDLCTLLTLEIYLTEVGFLYALSSSSFKLELIWGLQFNRGYISPYFVTDSEKMVTEYENCKVNVSAYISIIILDNPIIETALCLPRVKLHLFMLSCIFSVGFFVVLFMT